MKCSRCEKEAAIKQGNQWLCDKHYRFGQMRQKARISGKYVPTHDELEVISSDGMKCADCCVKMNWRAKDGQCTVASLQHYRNGDLAIVCRTCNTRHAFMPGDTYREMDKSAKLCPCCKEVKSLSEFYSDRARSGTAKRKSACKGCSNKKTNQWREGNREKYNKYQRERRERIKQEGN